MDGLPPEGTVNVPAENAPFRKVIDSTSMITVARLMPILATALLGALSWFGTTMLNDLKAGQMQVWTQVSKLADSQSASVAVVSGLSVQVANTAQQLTRLQTQFDSLPRR
jgi:hypothetical protein